MAWAGALAPGSRGCCSPRSSTSPIASAVRSPSPATVAETAASTGSKTSRAASRRTSLASSTGTDSAMPPAAAASNWCSAAW